MFPDAYEFAGWTNQDQSVLIYDRYDIWQIDPQQPARAKRLTNGRESKTIFRYLPTDSDVHFIDTEKPMLLHAHRETDCSEAYYHRDWNSGKMELLTEGHFHFTKKPLKAEATKDLVFTKENFDVFPDLQYAPEGNFRKAKQISNANPQQKDYAWGSIETYEWISTDGQTLQGLPKLGFFSLERSHIFVSMF